MEAAIVCTGCDCSGLGSSVTGGSSLICSFSSGAVSFPSVVCMMSFLERDNFSTFLLNCLFYYAKQSTK